MESIYLEFLQHLLAVVEPHSKAELNAMQDELCDGKVGTEGVRWGQAYLCASVVASMERQLYAADPAADLCCCLHYQSLLLKATMPSY